MNFDPITYNELRKGGPPFWVANQNYKWGDVRRSPDNAQRYVFRQGFIDSNTLTDTVDGVYFEYDQGQSPNWRCKTASNNSRTIVTTSVVVQNANWIDLHINVDASAQIARFYIDDVLVATINTNIPTSPGRETSIGYVIAKTVGGTARYVCLDRIYFKLNA